LIVGWLVYGLDDVCHRWAGTKKFFCGNRVHHGRRNRVRTVSGYEWSRCLHSRRRNVLAPSWQLMSGCASCRRRRKMIAAIKEGRAPDQALAAQGKNCGQSKNTFMVVPVVFLMISNHFPSTYGDFIVGSFKLPRWGVPRSARPSPVGLPQSSSEEPEIRVAVMELDSSILAPRSLILVLVNGVVRRSHSSRDWTESVSAILAHKFSPRFVRDEKIPPRASSALNEYPAETHQFCRRRRW